MKLTRLTLHTLVCALITSATATNVLAADTPASDRYQPQPGFRVEEVVLPESTGSLVAMAFDEQGRIIASRERGPLLLIADKDGDGTFESVTTFCDKVENCQGILPWGPHVFAVGSGPSDTAFYRLTDSDNNGEADKVETLFKFKGGMGEHGPHAPVLGPDGLIYLMIGNHSFVEPPVAETSPHHDFYNGELIVPKYEDANGHASGIKAPGGTVVRTDTNGSFIELFLGGFRNAYDHAFNRDGELFTYDSDMEWDVALPWYRPTRVNHLIPGAEFGWRSGWSKWPNYYVDSLPETLDIGRGSPTGVVFYNHQRFPEKYHGAFFMCDWSQGRVVAVTLDPQDGTYQGTSEIFLQGQPLNCSDIDVGPDGWLYISVGGRNTAGSILRVVADDAPPVEAAGRQGIAKAIRQPQLTSAWARRAARDVKQELGDQWGPSLLAVADNSKAASSDRTRALDLMQLFGPAPANDLLVRLSSDDDANVRAKATYLMGIHTGEVSNQRLVSLLDDADPVVRRRACEALVRARHLAPVDKLLPIMAEPHPFVSWAARRALEEVPQDQWRTKVLESDDPRVFVTGSVALVVTGADRDLSGVILEQCGKRLNGDLSDDDLLGVLRVVELALHRGEFKGEEQVALREQISSRFPTGDYRLNRELIRTLVMLQDPTLTPRLVKHLGTSAPLEERIQAAMLARFLSVGWTPESRGQLLDFFAMAKAMEGGGNSYRGYLSNGANDVLKTMPPEEQLARIKEGAKDPASALGIVQSLSGDLASQQVAALCELDEQLAEDKSPVAQDLAKACLVALGHGDDAAADYLGQVFDAAPERRAEAAQALATLVLKKIKRAADRERLVRSLTVVDGSKARDVLRALARFPQRNDNPQDLRQVILQGLKLGDNGGRDAVVLLSRWTGESVAEVRAPWQQGLAAWQKWFVKKYPNQPEPVPPVEPAGTKWTFAQLHDFLTSESGYSGDAQRGALVFEKAQCVKCHRYGTRGEGIGPDLSKVSSRFQRKEIIESVVFPSQVISDQFAAKTVVTADGKTFTGLVGETSDGVVVLQANTEKATVPKADIEEIVPSKLSAMPEGLFNNLTLDEIADLFVYMSAPPTEN
jgi:putative heme-binding domain-containing protein